MKSETNLRGLAAQTAKEHINALLAKKEFTIVLKDHSDSLNIITKMAAADRFIIELPSEADICGFSSASSKNKKVNWA